MATEVANNQQEVLNATAAAATEEAKADAAVVVTKTDAAASATDATAQQGEAAAVVAAAADGAATAADGEKSAVDEAAVTKADAGATEATPAVPAVKAAKVTAHKPDFEKDTIYLYQFTRTPLLPSLSPYCLKTETWLRLSGLKYENVDHKMKLRSKRGLLPFIELNGTEIADSSVIIRELSQKFDKDIDAALTQDQRNIAHATISMIENHLTWVVFWWRTKYPQEMLKGYQVNLQHALGLRIPNSILNLCFRFSYGRKGSKRVKAQGMGLHTPEEIEEFGRNDLKVLSDMLADKPFFFGDEPTTLDVVVFALLSQVHFINKEVTFAMRDFMTESCPNLVGHVSRIKERCYPDWDEICSKLDMNAHLPKPEAETKEGKEGETEKTAEQETNESDKIEKEQEKEKGEEKEKVEENKEKEEAK